MGRIQLNGEEILKTLKSIRRRWKIYKSINDIGSGLLMLGFIVFVLSSPFLLVRIDNIFVLFLILFSIIMVFIVINVVIKPLEKKTKKAYVDAYKNRIPKPVLEASLESVQFDFLGGYPRDDFKAIDLIKIDGHEYTSEDLITGIYKGVTFRRADIKITHRANKSTIVDADGRFLEIAFPKQMEGKVKIAKKKDPNTIFETDKVEMEDVDFNQKFDVFAKDKHSAFYLLTPQFMEYIKKLYDRDDRVYISFDGEKVYFLQSGSGGIFEPPKGKIDIWDEVRKCKAELKEIEEIIEVLQKNAEEDRTAASEKKDWFSQEDLDAWLNDMDT